MTVDIRELLAFAVKNRASDVHVGAGEVPSMRIDGEVRRLDVEPIQKEDATRLAYSIMNEEQRAAFEEHLEVDFSIGIPDVARFRAHVYTHSRGVGMALRQIPSRVLTLEEIGAPRVFQKIAELERGLVIVTGPAATGKSTTLAAMIDHINRTRPQHVITIEDPIEFVHTPMKCLVNQREVGRHTASFASGLRSAMREDPDAILIGEMKDVETTGLALHAAETGHLVFATLPTSSATETIDRIIGIHPPDQQDYVRSLLAATLQAVVAQLLIKPRSGQGRIAVHEILVGTPAVRNLVREGKVFQIPSVLQSSKVEGMQTMEMALKALVTRNRITREQAIDASGNPRMFEHDEPGVVRRGTSSSV
jgi:twitching motility protein PilT